MILASAIWLIGLATGSPSAWAYDPSEVNVSGHELPAELTSVNVEDRLGAAVNPDLVFTDEQGVSGPLSRFVGRGRPVVLAMVYFQCPSLCSLHLNGLTDALKMLSWTPGREFDVVLVSMDSRETHDLASRKKANYIKSFGRPESAGGWHFLVGDAANVGRLAEQIGFRFKWLEDRQQFAHASVTYILTPEGKISRTINGIQPDPQTLKFGLMEASDGKVGTVIDQVLMFCFQFNPQKNRYVLYAWNLMRFGAILMVLLLAIVLIPLWRREGGIQGVRK